jgi:hypothetical protein
MRAHDHSRAAALISALLLVFALTVLITATAQAAPPLTQLQRAHADFNAPFVAFGTTPGRAARALGGPLRGRGALIGRGVLAPGGAPISGATPWIAGGILAALLIGGTAAAAAASRRSQAQMASISAIGRSGASARPEGSEDPQRKAA